MPEKDPRRAERDAVHGLLPRRDAPEGRRRLRAGPDLSGGLRRSDEVPGRGPRAVRSPLQELSRAVGRPGRPDVAGQVLRGEGRDRRRDRPLQAAPGAHGDPRLRDLQRNVGYFYIVALAKRKQYALAADEADAMARDVQPSRRAAVEGRAGRACWSWPRPSTPRCPRSPRPSRPKAVKQIIDTVEPGGPIRLALQERSPGAAQEIQAQRRDEGRGDHPAHLPGRHGAGRRGDRLPGVGSRHHPAQGGRAQGRSRPRDRQGEPGPVQPGLLLLHEQAVLRGRRPGRAPRPALSAGRAVAQGDRDRDAGAGRRLQHLHRDRSAERHRAPGASWRSTRPRPGPTARKGTTPG